MALSHTTKAKTHFFEDSDLKQVLHVDDTANSFVKTKGMRAWGCHGRGGLREPVFRNPNAIANGVGLTLLGPRLHLRTVTFTIGSGSRSVEKLCQILEAGATCARIDLTVRGVLSEG